jgi:hypothetical protein
MRLSGGPIDSIPSAASASLSISCSKKRRCAAGSGVARTVSTTRLAPLAWQVKNASRGRPASVGLDLGQLHLKHFDARRERADALMAELLEMTADAMAAKEAAARLEGGQVRLRQELSDVQSDRDAWWSALSLLSTDVTSASACRGGSGSPGGRPTIPRPTSLLRQCRET